MSLKSAAENLANRLKTMEYVEMYAHYDADGIAAAAIMSIAFSRANISFKLKILPGIHASDVVNPEISLLCDFGASCTELPTSTMIIDHHIPYNTSENHVNPRLFGEDGEKELSGAGTAYLVANCLGDNRDLAGLVMLGIIGDNQSISGQNSEIINLAIENNLINPGKGVLLSGRTTKEQIANSLHPYLPKLSGNEDEAEQIAQLCMQKISDDDYTTCMVSQIIARSNASFASLMKVYGESWHLEREVIPNAHAFTAVVDACGKAGSCDIAYALCCGDASFIDEAWSIAVNYRKSVIDAVQSAEIISETPFIRKVSDKRTVSDAADIFLETSDGPIFVIGHREDELWISARAHPSSPINLEEVMRTTTESFGGTGGGHKTRAGGEVPLSCEAEFLKALEALVCA